MREVLLERLPLAGLDPVGADEDERGVMGSSWESVARWARGCESTIRAAPVAALPQSGPTSRTRWVFLPSATGEDRRQGGDERRARPSRNRPRARPLVAVAPGLRGVRSR